MNAKAPSMELSQSRCSEVNHVSYFFLSLTITLDFKSSLNTILIFSRLTPMVRESQTICVRGCPQQNLPTWFSCSLCCPCSCAPFSLISPNSSSIVHEGLALGENRVNSVLADSALSVCLPQIFIKYSIWSVTLSSETIARITCAISWMSSKGTCAKELAPG